MAAPFRELTTRPPGQIPALDAMRALAVLLVIFAHTSGPYRSFLDSLGASAGPKPLFISTGWQGVDLFFVLSGYFIGAQLWRELGRTGGIRFGRFMVRRTLRIWPLYFFFAWFAGAVLKDVNWPIGTGWSDFVFLTNYVAAGVVKGGWSLCTEEQFYILAPLIILFFARRGLRLRSYQVGLWILLAAMPVIRALTWYHLTGDLSVHDPRLFKNHLYQPIHTHADGLIIGLLLANLEITEGDRFKRGFFGSAWLVPCALVAALLLRAVHRESLDLSGISLLFGALVWYLLGPARPWLRFLEGKVFYLVSRLSFGMYLNHDYMTGPLIRYVTRTMPGAVPHAFAYGIGAFVAVTIASAALAVVTFCLIEHPFLALRARLLAAGRVAGGTATVATIRDSAG